jgi:hypothetical protein
MWIGFAAILGGAIGLFYVLLKTFGRSPWLWTTAFLVNIVLFSPVQYQNFLWAVQLAFLLPLGCLGMIVAVMRSRWWLSVKFVLCVVLSMIGTFSFGHGLVLWPVAICLALMLRGFAPMLPRLVFAGLLVLITAGTVWYYFNVNFINTSQPKHAYGTMPGERPPAINRIESFQENYKRVKYYFWSSLGNVMARNFHSDPVEVSVNTGRTFGWLFGGCLLWMLARWRKGGDWDALLPSAAVGTFAVVVAGMLATGRGSTMHLSRSLMPRYMSQTHYVCIAVIVMLAYILWHYHKALKRQAAVYVTYFAITLAAAFAALQSQQWIYGIHKMEAWHVARLEERFELIFLNHFVPRHPDRIDGDIDDAEEGVVPFSIQQAKYLNEIGHLQPPMFEEKGFGLFRKLDERAPLKRSDIVYINTMSDSRIAVRGFGTLLDGRIADGILVSWLPAEGAPFPRNLKDSKKERHYAKRLAGGDCQLLDVIEIYAGPAMRASFYDGQFGENQGNLSRIKNYARFEKEIDLSDIPFDLEVDLIFWVADTENMHLLSMKQVFRFKRRNLEPGWLYKAK